MEKKQNGREQENAKKNNWHEEEYSVREDPESAEPAECSKVNGIRSLERRGAGVEARPFGVHEIFPDAENLPLTFFGDSFIINFAHSGSAKLCVCSSAG